MPRRPASDTEKQPRATRRLWVHDDTYRRLLVLATLRGESLQKTIRHASILALKEADEAGAYRELLSVPKDTETEP